MSNDISIIRARLRCFKGRYPEVSEVSGLSTSWLSKFANGKRGRRPSFTTINTLEKALTALEGGSQTVPAGKGEFGSDPSQSSN